MIVAGWKRVSQSLRWKLGLPVAATELESGDEKDLAAFYNNRITDCEFLDDPANYEHPRLQWILKQVSGGDVLEIGCGNGGMTRHLAVQADQVTAMDVSRPSLDVIDHLKLANVRAVESLFEKFQPEQFYDWIVMSEVLEHLRRPNKAVASCLSWLSPGGSLLITTPNGHWESDEHLHEFSLDSFSRLIIDSGAEILTISYLRDTEQRRRWLTARIVAPLCPATPDKFHSRLATAKARKRNS